jgi:vacuolar-type H+-ATPase subunit I/STV1
LYAFLSIISAPEVLAIQSSCSVVSLPQMIFLNSLFGYLCIAIIYKWLSAKTTDLYHVMIYMFLSPGNVDEAGFLFPGQAGLQVRLVVFWLFFSVRSTASLG